jgi:cytochrome c peroxidase
MKHKQISIACASDQYFIDNLYRYGGLCIVVLWVFSLTACRKSDPRPEDNQVYSETPVKITSGVPGIPDPVIPANNPTTQEGVLLGRTLFYDRKLSADGRISCASCHHPEKAFTDGLALSKGIRNQQTTRNSMALVNLAWVNRFFWDGRVRSLEEQSLHPIEDSKEMGNTLSNMVATLQADPRYPGMFTRAFNTSTITPELVGTAISQFERTLISFNSKYDKYIRGETSFTPEELSGLALFSTHPNIGTGGTTRGGNCNDCHSVGLFQGKSLDFQGFLNNGIQSSITDMGLQKISLDTADAGKMRVPTLRNIALTAPYMHAGQLNTLEEVLDHYNHPNLFSRPNVDLLIKEGTNIRFGNKSLGLTTKEKSDIVAFLRTLTDTSFANNPSFRP